MTLFYPGPFEVRLQYTITISGVALQHTQRLNCDVTSNPTPGTIFSGVTVTKSGGGTQALNVAVDAWVAIMRAKFSNAACVITHAELWKYTPNTFETSFISDYVINLNGNGTGSEVINGEGIYSFRSVGGHIMKIFLMEPIQVNGAPVVYTNMFTPDQNLVDAILGANNSWKARDDTFPFVFLRFFPGESEAIFKKRWR